MALITLDNFTGLYSVAKNRHNEDDLETFIDTYEQERLQELLGCELFTLFEADLDASVPQVPQNSPFTEIYEPFCIDDDCGIVRSYGMVDMVTAFIYFEWVKRMSYLNTSGGTVVADSENSNHANQTSASIYMLYNRAIKSYQAIQHFICENESDYPTFKGISKEKAGWI